jgi:hypothetical protein
MAYIAPTDPTKKPGEQFLAAGGAPGAVASGSAPSSPPASDGGQRFGAMRSFFAANQPAADAQIGTIAQPIEDKAKEAQGLADESSKLYAEQGGAEKAGKALDAKNEALGMLGDTESQGGLAGMLGEGKGADYTEGQRNADAYLYGRAPGMQDFRSKWSGILGALNPSYATPIPLSKPKTPEVKPTETPQPEYGTPVYTDDHGNTDVAYEYDPATGTYKPRETRIDGMGG